MDSKHIKVKLETKMKKKISCHSVSCIFLTMVLCPVPPAVSMAPRIKKQTNKQKQTNENFLVDFFNREMQC